MAVTITINTEKNVIITVTAILTFFLWMHLYPLYIGYKTNQKNNDIRAINKSAVAYLDEVSKVKINSSNDKRLPGIMADTLKPLQPAYQFKPIFGNETVCLVIYQDWKKHYKGPLTITMVYFQDNKTGKRWYYPERYKDILK